MTLRRPENLSASPISVCVCLLGMSVAALLSGCSNAFAPGSSAAFPDGLTGVVHGGQQPLPAAQIYVFETSITGYGGNGIAASTSNASKSLIKSTTNPVSGYPVVLDSSSDAANGDYGVTTDVNGGFKVAAGLACTTGNQVYVLALGGKPGGTSGVNNPAAGLMAVIGQCTSGKVEDSLQGGNSRVIINEASTVAAAYALAGFATDDVHIGAYSATNPTLAQTGIANAIEAADSLESLTYGGSTARSTTPNGNGTVPTQLLNSLANTLGACINLASGACTTLANNATANGLSTGTKPIDTAQAAINIAHNPTANVSTLFSLPSSSGYVFYPYLTTVPNDFTVGIIYTGGGLTTPTYLTPRTLAVDASGNIWNANYSGATVSEFTTQGVPVVATGYATGLGPFSVAIDSLGHAWIADSGGNKLTEVHSGVATAKTVGGNLNEPTDVEFDGSGNMFISNLGSETIVEASNTAAYSGTTTASQNGLNGPYSVALEPGTAGGVWVANSGIDTVSYFTNALATTSNPTVGTGARQYINGIAVDAGGNAWATIDTTTVAGSINEITTGGTVTKYTPGSNNYKPEYDSVAVDGGDNLWMTDSAAGNVYEISNAGTTLSGTYGFPAAGNTPCTTASCTTVTVYLNSIAIDPSGNVWYTTTNDATLRELVGAAVPVTTPISAAVAGSQLGQEP